MYQRSDEDNDLDSAIYGQQASVSPPQPMSMTGVNTPTSTSGQSSMSPAPAPAPMQPTRNAPAPQPGGNGDIFASVYGQEPGNMSSLAAGSGAAGGAQGDGLMSSLAAPGGPLKGGTTTPGGQAGAGDPTASYRDAAARLAQTTDPQQQAQQRDSLARSLAADFQGAGHDVKWDGDVMIVDGRRYTVGGGDMASLGATPGGPLASNPNTGPLDPSTRAGGITDTATGQVYGAQGANSSGWNTDGYAAPAFVPSAAGNVPDGWDATKWNDPNHQTPKYGVGRILSTFPATVDGLKAAMGDITKAYPGATFDGKDKVTIPGVGTIDVLKSAGTGGAGWQWDDGSGGGAPGATGGHGIVGVDHPGAAGVNLGGPGGQPGAPPPPPGFQLSGPTYTPGAITDDDIPDFTTEGLASQMGGYTPERYDVGNMGVGAVEGDVDSLMRSILQHPESLGPEDVERMKVAGREEQADMERGDMDEMTALGYENGIESSNWLASQRLARRGQTSEAVSRNNRNVDIEAARTNGADRRSAAALGSSHLAEVGARKRGEEGLRQGGAKLNADNTFNAASLKSNNVTNAAKLTLDAAAQKGDRMALRESVNQAAAQLGISKDKLLLDYNLSTMQDMTQRYGIDVEAQLKREGFSIDRAQLAQAGSQFQEELAFKMRQLAQQYEVDMTGIGLGYDSLEQRANEFDTNTMMQSIYG